MNPNGSNGYHEEDPTKGVKIVSIEELEILDGSNVVAKETIEAFKDILGGDFFKTFRKKLFTKAVRVKGPFAVETSECQVVCEDGWLAIDARGYPYPIAVDEFDLIYEEVAQE
jgi:hypothetical protein